MAIHTRTELQSRFVNGAIPSQRDFRDLIDSMLNRRDDHFFGVWQQGMKYCLGDVVIYEKSLYMLAKPSLDGNCPPEEEQEEEGDAKSEGCICSTIPPTEDTERWCQLELIADDGDWQKIEVDGEVVTVYNLKAKIGIGTDHPATRLEITDGENGSIRLEPSKATHPAITLLHLPEEEGAGKVDYQLRQKVEWVTDSLGYAFFREFPELPADQLAPVQKSLQGKTPGPAAEPLVLLFITSHAGDQARVGVGTEQPRGTLHAYQAGRGEMVLNPGIAREPGLLLMNLEPAGNGYYLLSGVTSETAYLQTNAPDGFRLRKGPDHNALLKQEQLDSGESWVAVTGKGDVGIGTEEPRSKVEVHSKDAGSIRLDLAHDNPVVSTINARPTPGYPVTYHTIGVDDDAGTFITNAPKGFLFKKGGPCGQFNNEVNLNQGDKIVFIGNTGKVGIQTTEPPDDYDLEVNGEVKALASYLETDFDNIEQTGNLKDEDVLSKLEKVNPIRFKWKRNVNAENRVDQYGFNAQNVFEQFPGLVKKSGRSKAIAYGNMTAILVQAIKDQQMLIKQLEQRICDLEEQQGQTTSD